MSFSTPWKAPLKASTGTGHQNVSEKGGKKTKKISEASKSASKMPDKENCMPDKISTGDDTESSSLNNQKKDDVSGTSNDINDIEKTGDQGDVSTKRAVDFDSIFESVLDLESDPESLAADEEAEQVETEPSDAVPVAKKKRVDNRRKAPMKVTQMTDADYVELFDQVIQAVGNAGDERFVTPVMSTPKPNQSAARPHSVSACRKTPLVPETPPGEPNAAVESASHSAATVGITPVNTFLAPQIRKRIVNAPKQKKPRSSQSMATLYPGAQRKIDFNAVDVKSENEPKTADKNVAKKRPVFGDITNNKDVQKKKTFTVPSPVTPKVASDGSNSHNVGRAKKPDGNARKVVRGESQSPSQESQVRQTSGASNNMTQTISQISIMPLSQPPKTFSPRQRLEWLQERRDVGVWVRCDRPTCDKQRYLSNVKDPAALPDKWYCYMNPDKDFNTCSAPEKGPSLAEEEDMIYNKYTAGSLVWARMDGYPWWPAMVDDCPDTEQYYWLNGFSDIPTYYHVVFFDDSAVTRGWLKPSALKAYVGNEDNRQFSRVTVNGVNYGKRIEEAKKQATEAAPLPVAQRLKKYSFLARYTGKIDAKKAEREMKEEKERKYRKQQAAKKQAAKKQPAKKQSQSKRVKALKVKDVYSSEESDSDYEQDFVEKKRKRIVKYNPKAMSRSMISKICSSKKKTRRSKDDSDSGSQSSEDNVSNNGEDESDEDSVEEIVDSEDEDVEVLKKTKNEKKSSTKASKKSRLDNKEQDEDETRVDDEVQESSKANTDKQVKPVASTEETELTATQGTSMNLSQDLFDDDQDETECVSSNWATVGTNKNLLSLSKTTNQTRATEDEGPPSAVRKPFQSGNAADRASQDSTLGYCSQTQSQGDKVTAPKGDFRTPSQKMKASEETRGETSSCGFSKKTSEGEPKEDDFSSNTFHLASNLKFPELYTYDSQENRKEVTQQSTASTSGCNQSNMLEEPSQEAFTSTGYRTPTPSQVTYPDLFPPSGLSDNANADIPINVNGGNVNVPPADLPSENALVPNVDEEQSLYFGDASQFDAVVPQVNGNEFAEDFLNSSVLGSEQSEAFDMDIEE